MCAPGHLLTRSVWRAYYTSWLPESTLASTPWKEKSGCKKTYLDIGFFSSVFCDIPKGLSMPTF